MERGRGEILRERERERESYPSLPPSISPITLSSIISPSPSLTFLSFTLPHSLSLCIPPYLSLYPYPPYKPLSIYLPPFPSLSLFPTISLYLSLNFYTSPTLSLSFDSLSPYLRISLSILISPSLSLPLLLFSLRQISLSRVGVKNCG
jgi:hypothetical protein